MPQCPVVAIVLNARYLLALSTRNQCQNGLKTLNMLNFDANPLAVLSQPTKIAELIRHFVKRQTV